MILRRPENWKRNKVPKATFFGQLPQIHSFNLCDIFQSTQSVCMTVILITYRCIELAFLHAGPRRRHVSHWEIVDPLRTSFADAAADLYPRENLRPITIERNVCVS